MQRHAQERPAVGEYETHAFVGWFSHLDAVLLGTLCDGLKHIRRIAAGIFDSYDLQAIFARFQRVRELFNERVKRAPFPLRFGCCDEEFHGEVRAVVEIVVLGKCAMPRGLDGKR